LAFYYYAQETISSELAQVFWQVITAGRHNKEGLSPRRWRGLNKTPSMQVVFIGWDK